MKLLSLSLIALSFFHANATDNFASQGLPNIKRPSIESLNTISKELDFDLKMLLHDKVDYVTYDQMFDREFLHGLL